MRAKRLCMYRRGARGLATRCLQPAGCLALLMLLCGCGRKPERNPPQKDIGERPAGRPSPAAKVLLVHSYHKGYPWVDAITRGVRMAFTPGEVALEIFYMDTKRRTSDSWKKQRGELARKVVSDWQPDVVIAADDNAQQYFARHYAGTSSIRFVFCGVNAKPSRYGYPANNVTGIIERPHFEESLLFLKKLVPGVSRVAIVTDDSPTSAGGLEHMKAAPPGFEIVSRKTPGTFRQWQEAVREACQEADVIAIYMYHTVKRASQPESMPAKEVMAWTVANTTVPIVGFFIFAVDDGALCGYLESGVEHGLKAGKIAKQLLAGAEVEDFPIDTALEGQSMLNLTTANALGMQLPEELVRTVDIVKGK